MNQEDNDGQFIAPIASDGKINLSHLRHIIKEEASQVMDERMRNKPQLSQFQRSLIDAVKSEQGDLR